MNWDGIAEAFVYATKGCTPSEHLKGRERCVRPLAFLVPYRGKRDEFARTVPFDDKKGNAVGEFG